ncbi:MAG: Fic family protein [bacterium]
MKENSTILGRRVRCEGAYTAFVPAPLPPKLEWTPSLVSALSDADRLIGRLAGEGHGLPNPHLLIRPFIAREAVLSSRIEGTQATLGELLASKAGAAVDRSPDDLREVANYVAAMEHGISRLPTLPLSLRLIREVHSKLMKGVRGDLATPGEFRRSQNWIGPAGCTLATASYVPPPPNELMPCLGELETFLNERSVPPLIQIAMAHYQFEAIHPFLDGNGRVGRLLVPLFLVERGVLPQPLLYLSAFFEATRPDYYRLLRGVTDRGAWAPWIEYFLNGVARQSEDALNRTHRMNQCLAKWRLAAAGLPSRTPVLILEMLADNPFLTVTKAAKDLNVAFTTVQRAVDRLEALSIVAQVGEAKRDRVYCAKALLSILDEPAQLVAEVVRQRRHP